MSEAFNSYVRNETDQSEDVDEFINQSHKMHLPHYHYLQTFHVVIMLVISVINVVTMIICCVVSTIIYS